MFVVISVILIVVAGIACSRIIVGRTSSTVEEEEDTITVITETETSMTTTNTTTTSATTTMTTTTVTTSNQLESTTANEIPWLRPETTVKTEATTNTTTVTETTTIQTTTEMQAPDMNEVAIDERTETNPEMPRFADWDELPTPDIPGIMDRSEDLPTPDLSEITDWEELPTPEGIIERASVEKRLYSYASSENTWFNICHSLDELNGYVLYPGESFNWEVVMGDSGVDRGYRVSTQFEGKRITEGYGGGVCFTSTLLYQVAKEAGLQIIDHKDHSRRVKYAKPGEEAAVSYGTKNNIFLNDTAYTVVFHTEYDTEDYTNSNLIGCISFEFVR